MRYHKAELSDEDLDLLLYAYGEVPEDLLDWRTKRTSQLMRRSISASVVYQSMSSQKTTLTVR